MPTTGARDRNIECVVSPQRLVHYRDSWLIDAYCHLRKALRTFSVGSVRSARKLEEVADTMPDEQLDEYFASSYGIFSGRANKTAILRFIAKRVRWVAHERLQPDQVGEYLTDGCYGLRIRYRDDRGLLMDTLRDGPEVEVVSPPKLRVEIERQLRAALAQYAVGTAIVN